MLDGQRNSSRDTAVVTCHWFKSTAAYDVDYHDEPIL